MGRELVIGMDVSTTACKAIAWDQNGTAVAEGRANYPLLHPQPGWHEQDAEGWWAGGCAALRDCLGAVDVREVQAVCVTHQRETFVPLDKHGLPLRNAIIWADERSPAQVLELERRFGRERIHEITGKPPSMTASISKVLWLVQNEPETVVPAHRIVEVGAYMAHRLTGEFHTSVASADPMGLVDLQARTWSREVIEGLGLQIDQFCELFDPGTVLGTVTATASRATGLPEGLPVIAGAGDGQCAGLGANALDAERAYLNLGTAVVSGVVSDVYPCDRAFRTLLAPVPGRYFAEHVLRGGVFMISWFVERFASDLQDDDSGHSPEEVLEEWAAAVEPGAEGLLLVPYWNNVMNPYWDPFASGITIGWTASHGRAHFYRAIMEGIAYEQRLVGDAMMQAVGRRFGEYVTMGGGSRSGLWRQIVADVTGVPVRRSTATEATCLGAGILAATAAGWYPDAATAAAHMTSTSDLCEPNPESQARYDRLYREVYQPLFPLLQPFADRLTVITRGG